MKKLIIVLLPLALALATAALAKEIVTLRGGTPIDAESEPAPMPRVDNSDIKRKRNYPMQPPVIPHDTRGYEINLQVNKCLACHARHRTEDSQAPMISVTHYMDRDGNFLAEVSPRRYFCNQCHVNQAQVNLPVENDFHDMDALLGDTDGQER
ncbi:nitrate reductase cytochrome c-type subunit [Marinihelvus fidelis]|uniref:Periplasmic nitrate reductase, electron transfer subunit n=1 Tax=Marinihelvus fidelis TaxID=2613842 RepID=A0A5N0T9E7_9GAMM|nr:nitrate reductase cytochrome c-type subunit [Marinihelvus fidelis]KAA9131572.1 nitrate reductase cytochrome c-type subunit [Marinihelvus fidelis]